MPERPDARMPLYLTESQKEMLISSGTYNASGTVNMETARRFGWIRKRPRETAAFASCSVNRVYGSRCAGT
jgi:hypothetical protein